MSLDWDDLSPPTSRLSAGGNRCASIDASALRKATATIPSATPSITTALGGGLGYVFVLLMALTSHDYWVKRLTPKGWRRLHTIGAIYIAFIFAFSYYGRLPTKPVLAIATLSLMALVIALRVAAWAKKRAPQAS